MLTLLSALLAATNATGAGSVTPSCMARPVAEGAVIDLSDRVRIAADSGEVVFADDVPLPAADLVALGQAAAKAADQLLVAAAAGELVEGGGGLGHHVQTDRRSITPRSPNQAAYLRALEQRDLVFALGPAGTGKTYRLSLEFLGLLLQYAGHPRQANRVGWRRQAPVHASIHMPRSAARSR